MTDSYPFGPLTKAKWSYLIFAVPAVLIFGVTAGLIAQEVGSLNAALQTGAVQIMGLVGLAFLIWGLVFLQRPIAVLTPDGLRAPGRDMIRWSDIADIRATRESTTSLSQSTGARQVSHDVIWIACHDDTRIKLTATLAAKGPEAAYSQLIAAHAAGQSA